MNDYFTTSVASPTNYRRLDYIYAEERIVAVHVDENSTKTVNSYNVIEVKEGLVQGTPKGSSIQATIDGHYLSIVFLENLGQVDVEVTSVTGGEVQAQSTPTPNGVDFYIISTGNFIVTFTLPNGDEYYGEFSITN